MKAIFFQLALIGFLCSALAKADGNDCNMTKIDSCRSAAMPIGAPNCDYEAVCTDVNRWANCYACDCQEQTLYDISIYVEKTFGATCTGPNWSADDFYDSCRHECFSDAPEPAPGACVQAEVEQCQASTLLDDLPCEYEELCDHLIEWTECHRCDCSDQSLDDVGDYLEKNFEGVCNKSDPSWDMDVVGQLCIPRLHCTREGPIDTECLKPHEGCMMNLMMQMFMLQSSEDCLDQDAVCGLRQEIADTFIGCDNCASMVEMTLNSMNSTCDLECADREVVCNRDPEISTCVVNDCVNATCQMEDEMKYMMGLPMQMAFTGCPSDDEICETLHDSTKCISDSCSCEQEVDMEFMLKRISTFKNCSVDTTYLIENCFCKGNNGGEDEDTDGNNGGEDEDTDGNNGGEDEDDDGNNGGEDEDDDDLFDVSASTRVASFSYFIGTVFLANVLRVTL